MVSANQLYKQYRDGGGTKDFKSWVTEQNRNPESPLYCKADGDTPKPVDVPLVNKTNAGERMYSIKPVVMWGTCAILLVAGIVIGYQVAKNKSTAQ